MWDFEFNFCDFFFFFLLKWEMDYYLNSFLTLSIKKYFVLNVTYVYTILHVYNYHTDTQHSSELSDNLGFSI